ncbi:MAG: hypothetical protein E6G56_08940 [Actinobacteria bacterium]|nr:MAG: hypothetical protein E6G56_08940 [Actinomycetota bacterium]
MLAYQQGHVGLVARAAPKILARDLGDQPVGAGAHRARHPGASVGVGRAALDQVLGLALAQRIGVGRGHLAQRPVGIDHVDHAQIGQLGHHRVHEPAQDLLVVQRGLEQGLDHHVGHHALGIAGAGRAPVVPWRGGRALS